MESKVSEKDMREVYFQAFGKEYDSADRKQAPLPLEIAYLVALNKLKKEGKYAGGGEITNDIYFQSVSHFIYFCMNYPNNFLDAFGGLKNHLSNKFKDYYNKYGTYGVMIKFYAELDAENKRTLTDYSLKNYKGSPISSDVSEVEYFNSVNHFVYFCFNFPSNFLDAFSSHLKVHLSSKWINAYEKKGSIGGMIYFWSELDNQNRRKLADWVRVNYKGTKLYEVGGMLGDVAGMLPSPLPMSTIQPMAKGGYINKKVKYTNKTDGRGIAYSNFGDGHFVNVIELRNPYNQEFNYGVYDSYDGQKINLFKTIEEADFFYNQTIRNREKNSNIISSEKRYSDGGGVKSDYYIFEGVDNINRNPLYRVESSSESENEYVGEWHTDKKDAQKELDGLSNNSLGVVKVIFKNPEYNYITNVGAKITESEARKYFVGKMFDVGVYPKENMQKAIDIEFSKSKDSYADGGEIVDLFEDYENIPANVQEVFDRYSEKYGEDFGEMDYNDMAEMHKEIEKLGYTFDSGLDNMPYGLRPIGVELNQLRGYEEFGLGGFLLGAGLGIAGSYLYNNSKVEKNKDGVKLQIKKPKKVFKYGGEIEERVKTKLSRNFTLPFEVIIYVPSTKDADTTISQEEFKNRISEVEVYVAKLFGGFSSNPVDGGYNSDEKGLIKEDVFKVYSFASRDGFEPKMEELVNQVKNWCKEWGQEAIGLEFEGDLFYVEA